ncbi:hypothetical protein CEXT_441151 [Caerostris extrusa]|uniref:Uncharacterized protein n=1 Tax=Caerostris extrusa TaxID=172846 RepID=A0AAV4XGS9_CAEEX|nr:hypothetical protein CEXT_441151 [Caerostris extrusa]
MKKHYNGKGFEKKNSHLWIHFLLAMRATLFLDQVEPQTHEPNYFELRRNLDCKLTRQTPQICRNLYRVQQGSSESFVFSGLGQPATPVKHFIQMNIFMSNAVF